MLRLSAFVMNFVDHVLFLIMTDIFGARLVNRIEANSTSIYNKTFNIILQVGESYLQIMNVFLTTMIVNWRYWQILHFYYQRVYHLVFVGCYLLFQGFRSMKITKCGRFTYCWFVSLFFQILLNLLSINHPLPNYFLFNLRLNSNTYEFFRIFSLT